MDALASIVIRTLNEERYLGELLHAVESQDTEAIDVEVVIVDSGSTDRTLEVAESFGCRIECIDPGEFSFGGPLNVGCRASLGEILVFVSGHCVPIGADWLERLVEPLLAGAVELTYGRQVGGPRTQFSESQLFAKQYPARSAIPHEGIFCNNANSALRREVWSKYGFDEETTGLEDMALAKTLLQDGLQIGYVAEACVAHHHDESFRQVMWRFEREALALQEIMPEIQVSFADFVRYFLSATLLDFGAALSEGRLTSTLVDTLGFRFAQYWGSYRGNHEHRRLSRARKEHYFYPRGRAAVDKRSGRGATG